jgi:hypothetical protein
MDRDAESSGKCECQSDPRFAEPSLDVDDRLTTDAQLPCEGLLGEALQFSVLFDLRLVPNHEARLTRLIRRCQENYVKKAVYCALVTT